MGLLDNHSREVRIDPDSAVVFIAPVRTPAPAITQGDPGEEWELLYPAVPDAPPDELDAG